MQPSIILVIGEVLKTLYKLHKLRSQGDSQTSCRVKVRWKVQLIKYSFVITKIIPQIKGFILT